MIKINKHIFNLRILINFHISNGSKDFIKMVSLTLFHFNHSKCILSKINYLINNQTKVCFTKFHFKFNNKHSFNKVNINSCHIKFNNSIPNFNNSNHFNYNKDNKCKLNFLNNTNIKCNNKINSFNNSSNKLININ